MRKLIAFDDDTFDKLKQLGRDRMATLQELADEAFADLLKKHGIPDRPERRATKECRRLEESNAKENEIRKQKTGKSQRMTTDPDPFEQGRARRARKHSRRSQSLSRTARSSIRSWAPVMRQIAGAIEASESEGN